MDRRVLVENVITKCKTSLVGVPVPDTNLKIDSIFWYGAVDIAPQHCVVWVILSGRGEETLPAWFFPADSKDDTPFRQWTRTIEKRIIQEFAAGGWDPSWPAPRIWFRK